MPTGKFALHIWLSILALRGLWIGVHFFSIHCLLPLWNDAVFSFHVPGLLL